jgi:nucleotide-binding universal stress UspA family protein
MPQETAMINIQRILCPTDFSDEARHALDHATALARRYDAQLTLLHVISLALPPAPVFAPYHGYPEMLAPKLRDDLTREIEKLAAGARAQGVPAEIAIREGDVVNRILEQARELPADVLVIGTHGAGGFERLMLGSVTEKALRRAPCPVLSVPPRAGSPTREPLTFKTILCAVDFSESSDRAAEYALLLAQEADARLILLHVMEVFPEREGADAGFADLSVYQAAVEERARERLRQAMPPEARNWCTPEEQVLTGKPYVQILRVAEQERADVIVLGVQGRNPLDLMLFGSTANHVVRQASCPVLTIRAS